MNYHQNSKRLTNIKVLDLDAIRAHYHNNCQNYHQLQAYHLPGMSRRPQQVYKPAHCAYAIQDCTIPDQKLRHYLNRILGRAVRKDGKLQETCVEEGFDFGSLKQRAIKTRTISNGVDVAKFFSLIDQLLTTDEARILLQSCIVQTKLEIIESCQRYRNNAKKEYMEIFFYSDLLLKTLISLFENKFPNKLPMQVKELLANQEEIKIPADIKFKTTSKNKLLRTSDKKQKKRSDDRVQPAQTLQSAQTLYTQFEGSVTSAYKLLQLNILQRQRKCKTTQDKLRKAQKRIQELKARLSLYQNVESQQQQDEYDPFNAAIYYLDEQQVIVKQETPEEE